MTSSCIRGAIRVGGGTDAFATKLDPTGSSLVYSTYLGGTGSDTGFDIAIDGTGSAYVMGRTSSADFPTMLLAADPTYNGHYAARARAE